MAEWVNDFIKCLQESTSTRPLQRQAFQIKEAHTPDRLYKYRAVSEHSLSNLESNTIWMSSPDDYNDPYDCALRLSFDALQAAFASSLRLLANVPASILAAMRITVGTQDVSAEEYISSGASEMAREAVEGFHEIREMTKICSFSTVCDSILMWSHYADNHRGFCIEYDTSGKTGSEDKFRRSLFPVIYSEEIFDMNSLIGRSVRDNLDGAAGLLPVLRKAIDWQYEQEWRFVETEMASRHTYPMRTPLRVFLGSKISDENMNKIKQACKKRHIEVIQMHLAADRYKLIAQPSPD